MLLDHVSSLIVCSALACIGETASVDLLWIFEPKTAFFPTGCGRERDSTRPQLHLPSLRRSLRESRCRADDFGSGSRPRRHKQYQPNCGSNGRFCRFVSETSSIAVICREKCRYSVDSYHFVLSGHHAVVASINNFIPISMVEYYTKPQGLEKDPKLPPIVAPALHSYLIQVRFNNPNFDISLCDNFFIPIVDRWRFTQCIWHFTYPLCLFSSLTGQRSAGSSYSWARSTWEALRREGTRSWPSRLTIWGSFSSFFWKIKTAKRKRRRKRAKTRTVGASATRYGSCWRGETSTVSPSIRWAFLNQRSPLNDLFVMTMTWNKMEIERVSNPNRGMDKEL